MARLFEEDEVTGTHILVQIARNVGQVSSDVANVKEQVQDLSNDVKVVRERLASTVTKPECQRQHSDLKDVMVKEYKKHSSSLHGYPAITENMLKDPTAVIKLEEALETRKEEKEDKQRRRFIAWLTVVSISIPLLGGAAAGVYRLVKVVDRLGEVVSDNTSQVKALERKTEQVLKPEPLLTEPDAGVHPNKRRQRK